jgi:pimeloyl-ACP methyl ester carboxylesterase
MSLIGTIVTVALLALLAFTIYYHIVKRVLHIELRAREIHTILTPDGWRIRLFRYRKGGSSGEPVLLVHGYTANHWNMALPPDASLTDYLVAQGHDCWVIDLRGNRTSLPPPGTPRHRATYDGYVMEDLPSAVSFIRQSTGYDQLHWVGHSMGGMLLYAYELAHGRAHIASGTTIASPPWLEPFWTKWENRLVWFMETAPHLFEILKRAIAPVYAWLKPRYRMIPVQWENLHPDFGVAAFFNAVEQSPGPVTRTFEECAKHRYLAVDNDRINVLQGLGRLETPLLVVACALDPIAPPSNLRAFFDRLPSPDKRFLELSKAAGCKMDYSHIDPPFARNGAVEVFAPIAEWIAAHPARRAEKRTIPKSTDAPTVTFSPLPAAAGEAKMKPLRAKPETAAAGGATPWGTALKNAADILSGLDEETAATRRAKSAARAGRATRKPPAPSRPARATSAKKSAANKKKSTKSKKAASITAARTSKPAETPAGQRDTRPPRGKKAVEQGRSDNGADAPAPKATPRKVTTKTKAGRKRAPKEQE